MKSLCPPHILINFFASRHALKRGLLVLVVGTTLGLGVAYGLRKTLFKGPNVSPAPISLSVLQVSDEGLNIGTVYETGGYIHRLHITNPNSAPITIQQFQRSCTCADISPGQNVTLLGGETVQFTLDLDLAIRTPKADLSRDHPFLIELSPVCVTPDGRTFIQVWRIAGTVRPTIRTNPMALWLGPISEKQKLFEASFEVETSSYVKRIETEPHSAWTTRCAPNENVADRYTITIEPKTSLTPRAISDTIKIIPVGTDDRRLPAKEVKLTGEITRDVVSSPQVVHFGPRNLGASCERLFQLRSLTNRRFRVERTAIEGEDLQVVPDAAPNEQFTQSAACRVRQKVAKAGEQESKVTFRIHDEDGATYDISVPIRYFGIADSKSPSPMPQTPANDRPEVKP